MSRQGFIKYCLQEGYTVVPCYTFGESDTYLTYTGGLALRLWLAKRNIPACAMVGHWLCPLLPRGGVHLITYLGEPLQASCHAGMQPPCDPLTGRYMTVASAARPQLPRIAEPSKADVEAWHAKYVEALKATFEKNKAEAGKPEAVLEIW